MSAQILFIVLMEVLDFSMSASPIKTKDLACSKFSLTGNEKTFYPFDLFLGDVPCANMSLLHDIYLSYLEVDQEVLLSFITKAPNLRAILLDNVVWSGNFKEKLILPSLKYVVIMNRRKWGFPRSTSEELLSSLFFMEVPNGNNGKSTNVDLTYTAEYGGSLTYYPTAQYLLANNVPYDVINYFTVKHLEIDRGVLDLKGFDGTNLSTLKLNHTKLLNGNITKLISSIGKDLEIIEVLHSNVYDFLENIDVATLSVQVLQSLKLTHVDVFATTPLLLESLQEFSLKHGSLNTTGINFPPEILRIFELQDVTILETNGLEALEPLECLDVVKIVSHDFTFNITILSKSASTINKLHFEDIAITVTDIFQFQYINQLVISNSSIKAELLTQMNEVFQNTDEIVLDIKMTVAIFRRILETSCMNIEVMKGVEENDEIRNFLDSAHVPREASHFLLSKGAANGIWRNEELTIKFEELAMDDNLVFKPFVFYPYVIILTFISITGVLGNTATIYILSRKELWSSTSCILIGLAIFDTMTLLTSVLLVYSNGLKLMYMFVGVNRDGLTQKHVTWEIIISQLWRIFQIPENYFRFSVYSLNKIGYTGSVYTTVLLTVERFYAVCYPLFARAWRSTKISIFTLLGVFATALLINIPRWFEQGASRIELSGNQYLDWSTRIYEGQKSILSEKSYRQYYHGWLWTIFMYIIPIPLLSILNFKISKTLEISIIKRRSLTQQSQQERNEKGNTDQSSLTILLVCISTIFILCNTLNGIIVLALVSYGNYYPVDIEVFSSIPVILNSSINFFVYFLMGKKFRNELIKRIPLCIKTCQ